MGTVIGFKDTPNQRLKTWLAMLEHKQCYNHFKKSLGEQEQEIAELDKQLYYHNLNNYVQRPDKVA